VIGDLALRRPAVTRPRGSLQSGNALTPTGQRLSPIIPAGIITTEEEAFAETEFCGRFCRGLIFFNLHALLHIKPVTSKAHYSRRRSSSLEERMTPV